MVFRLQDSILHYDSFDDEKKLYNKAMDMVESRSQTISEWVSYYVLVTLIFEKQHPSIQQLKKDLQKVFK
jgi:hypothetical protein